MRKMRGFYVATAALFIVVMFVIFRSNVDTDFVEIFKYYAVFQGLITGGFFGFNFGEHWAKSRVQGMRNNDSRA